MTLSDAFQSWYQTGSTLQYQGHAIFYREEGKGQVVICLHGVPTASWDWHPVWGQLAQHYRLIAPDFLGFGYSDKPRSQLYTIAGQADLVEALLKDRGVYQAHILAHDYGDTIALELLARRNAGSLSFDILSVCLLNGGLFPESYRPRPIQKLLLSPIGPLLGLVYRKRSFERTFSGIFGPQSKPNQQQLDEFWHLVTHNGGRLLIHKLFHYMSERVQYRERWVGALQQAGVPLRFINGLEDPISGAHVVARYRELVPNPDVVELSGIGHYPQVEAPDRVLKAYQEFLTAVNGSLI